MLNFTFTVAPTLNRLVPIKCTHYPILVFNTAALNCALLEQVTSPLYETLIGMHEILPVGTALHL